MYPLISGIVLGGKQRLSTARPAAGLYLRPWMALTYTALGLVVAAAGLQFRAALQHPYVPVGLSAVLLLAPPCSACSRCSCRRRCRPG